MDERSLNELLECSVCLDRLDATSKVLPCQHTFCRRCLHEIVITKKELRCPECRLLVELRVEDLPTNILLIRLLEGLKTAAVKSGSETPTSGSSPAIVTSSPSHASGSGRNNTHTKSSPSHKVNLQPCAKALYNYVAKEVGDLSFKKGDLIILKKQVDENWFQGELDNNHGFFPAIYVQILTPLPQQDVPQCKALYDFVLNNHREEKDCLTFHKGETMTVIRRVDDNWVEGCQGNRIGIFPIAFVEMNDAAKWLISSQLVAGPVSNREPLSHVSRPAHLRTGVPTTPRSSSINPSNTAIHSSASHLTTNSSASHLTTNSTASHLTTNPSASHLTTNPSASHLTTNPSASHLTTNPSASHLTTNPSASHLTTNPSASHLTTNPSASHLTTAYSSVSASAISTCISSSASVTITSAPVTSARVLTTLCSGDILNSAIDHCLSLITSGMHINKALSKVASVSSDGVSTARTTVAGGLDVSVQRRAPHIGRLQQQQKRHSFNGETVSEDSLTPVSDSTLRRSLDLLSSPRTVSTATSCASHKSAVTVSSDADTAVMAKTTTAHSEGAPPLRQTLSMPLPSIYTALYSYKPEKTDELELVKGHYYTVTERCQDGWYKGACLHTGQLGVFPGNYVNFIKLSPSKSSRPDVPRQSQPATEAGDAGTSQVEAGNILPIELPQSQPKSHTSLSRHHSFPKSGPVVVGGKERQTKLGLSALGSTISKVAASQMTARCVPMQLVGSSPQVTLPSSKTSAPCSVNLPTSALVQTTASHGGASLTAAAAPAAAAATAAAAAVGGVEKDVVANNHTARDSQPSWDKYRHHHHKHRASKAHSHVEAPSSRGNNPVPPYSQREPSRSHESSEPPVLGRAAARLKNLPVSCDVVSSAGNNTKHSTDDGLQKQVTINLVSASQPQDPCNSSSSKTRVEGRLSSAKASRRTHNGRICAMPAGSNTKPSTAGHEIPPNVVMGSPATQGQLASTATKKGRHEKEPSSSRKKHLVSSARRKTRTTPAESLSEPTERGERSGHGNPPVSKIVPLPGEQEVVSSGKPSSRKMPVFVQKASSLDSTHVQVDGCESQAPASAPVSHNSANSAKSSGRTKSHDSVARYRCMVSYPAQSDVELELKPGDIVYVHKKREDGWYKGTLQRSGKSGLFPASFVESC